MRSLRSLAIQWRETHRSIALYPVQLHHELSFCEKSTEYILILTTSDSRVTNSFLPCIKRLSKYIQSGNQNEVLFNNIFYGSNRNANFQWVPSFTLFVDFFCPARISTELHSWFICGPSEHITCSLQGFKFCRGKPNLSVCTVLLCFYAALTEMFPNLEQYIIDFSVQGFKSNVTKDVKSGLSLYLHILLMNYSASLMATETT